MKASDLHKVWSAPDNSKLTPKQQSFRLPLHVAAKIAALCDMYPQKTKTEIVGDLLASALIEVERGFPPVKGENVGPHPDTQEIMYEDIGPAREFRRLANQHYAELERELGSEDAMPLYSENTTYCVSESDLERTK